MVKVLVTGANGQLGQALQAIASEYTVLNLIFCDSKSLDITQPESVERAFKHHSPQYCLNTAAYTAVDKAESEEVKAYSVNVAGVGCLAAAAKKQHAKIIHVSTDFVFDGKKDTPYTETDEAHPTCAYGRTKREGEILLQQTCPESYIVRTSWVYSEYGHNFMKTMLKLAAERDTLSIVSDQTGTPTNAHDLAKALLSIIVKDASGAVPNAYGIYNFSNEGSCTWFDFAKAIFESRQIGIDVKPISSSEYPTPAARPKYSVLDKSKIKTIFGIHPLNWKQSLTQIHDF